MSKNTQLKNQNFGSGILIDNTAVSPSLMSSPDKEILFFLAKYLEYSCQ